MNLNTVTPQKVLLLLFCVVLNFSCSKDSDLFYDVVSAEIENNISEESADQESMDQEDTESEDTENEDSNEEVAEEQNDEGNPDDNNTGDDSTPDDEVSNDEQAKGSGTLVWYSDFETDQWNLNGTGANNWEYEDDRGKPETTTDSRAGSRAVHLGDYNNHITRNELHRNRMSDWGEHWIGFSIKVKEASQNSRVYAQFRNMRPEGAPDHGGINPVTLRQGSPGRMYFATSTVEANVDVVYESGASTGTESTYFDYDLDEWIDVVIHWKLDPEDGFMQIWVNGDKILDKTGTTTYRYANVSGIPYTGEIKHTIGVYWSRNNSPQGNVYFDEYKVWKGDGAYENVSPGGLSPNN